MRRGTLITSALIALVLLIAPACTNNSIDDGDTGNVQLEVLAVENPAVTGAFTTGTCINSGLTCLTDLNCDPGDPTDVCVLDITGGGCTIIEWTATFSNVPKSALAVESPFNDLVVSQVRLDYEWLTVPATTDSRTVPLSLTVPANSQASTSFFPITNLDFDELIAGIPTGTAVTGLVTMTFTGQTIDGEPQVVVSGEQLFIEACF